MGDTKVACIGQWLTSTRRGSRWRSFCALKKTRCWEPQMKLSRRMGRSNIPILHGQICFISRKTTTEQTKLLCQTSSTGSYLPKLHTSFSLTYKSILFYYFFFFNHLLQHNLPSKFSLYFSHLHSKNISLPLPLPPFSAPTYLNKSLIYPY